MPTLPGPDHEQHPPYDPSAVDSAAQRQRAARHYRRALCALAEGRFAGLSRGERRRLMAQLRDALAVLQAGPSPGED